MWSEKKSDELEFSLLSDLTHSGDQSWNFLDSDDVTGLIEELDETVTKTDIVILNEKVNEILTALVKKDDENLTGLVKTDDENSTALESVNLPKLCAHAVSIIKHPETVIYSIIIDF